MNHEALDTTPPEISVPPDGVTVNATTPQRGIATFSVTATDALTASSRRPACPASGSVFPIGQMTVNCTAKDAAGTVGKASFTVTVKGALAQIDDEIAYIQASSLGASTKASLINKLTAARAALVAEKPKDAKSNLNAALSYIKVQRGKTIPQSLAVTLTADITRIKAVIG